MIATGQARRSHRQERIATWLLRSASAFVIVVMAFLLIYLTFEGTKTFTVDGVSPFEFLFSTNYQPDTKHPGAAVFIVGSLAITLFAIVVGGPFGIAVGVFLSELAPKQMSSILKPAIEVMVGVPSVVYGWIGLTLLVPLMRQITGGVGFGLASSGIVLAIMILPTVISLSEDAFKSLPPALKEASMAVGATRWQTIVQVLLPAASSGLTVAVILGVARAVGETLAVQLVIGNATILPAGLFAPTAALTTEIITDMPGAAPNSPLEHALFSMALLLLLIAMGLIVLVRFALRKRN
jgi:phosphate transport system permease protein